MPTCQGLQSVPPEAFVVVQQDIECGAMPAIIVFVQSIGIALFVRVVLDKLSESLVVLPVVDVCTGQGSHQSIKQRIVSRQDTGEILILAPHRLVHIQPCNRASVRNSSPSTVFVACHNPRSHFAQTHHNLLGTVFTIRRVRVGIIIVDVCHVDMYVQTGIQFNVQIGASVELLAGSIGQCALLLQVAYGHQVFQIIRTTTHVHVVRMLDTSTVSQIIPVSIRIIVRIGTIFELFIHFSISHRIKVRRSSILHERLIIEACIVVRAHEVLQHGRILQADIAVVDDARLPRLSAFGGDKDNAVGGF